MLGHLNYLWIWFLSEDHLLFILWLVIPIDIIYLTFQTLLRSHKAVCLFIFIVVCNVLLLESAELLRPTWIYWYLSLHLFIEVSILVYFFLTHHDILGLNKHLVFLVVLYHYIFGIYLPKSLQLLSEFVFLLVLQLTTWLIFIW